MYAVLEIDGLTRSFGNRNGEVPVLRGVDLSLARGETLGLLGVNGAGKTTLLKIISTLLLPTSGQVRVAGFDVVRQTRAARRHLAVVLGGERGFYNRLTACENVKFFAVLAGVPLRTAKAKALAALERVNLAPAADRAVETFSKGMKQRLHLAVGFVTEPDLLLLDEPTVGLDPIEAERLRGTIAALQRSGVSIVLTSHYLHDIEQLAQRVVVLHDGVIAHDMALADLLRSTGGAAELSILVRGPRPYPGSAPGVLEVTPAPEVGPDVYRAVCQVPEWSRESLSALSAWWPQGEILDVQVRPASLERAFARIAVERGADVQP